MYANIRKTTDFDEKKSKQVNDHNKPGDSRQRWRNSFKKRKVILIEIRK